MFDTVKRVHTMAAENGMNLYQFCCSCGISYSTIKSAEIRAGQLKIDTIERICAARNISFAEFFNEPPE